ncbi:MAG TPA: hypothetical protein PK413_17570, partial [Thermoanaerobaculia bacterium]|nr:hypothetical protein [Thermoanaerobaculia bacterium]
MVDEPDAHDIAGVGEAPGEEAVLDARLRVAARVGMEKDESRGSEQDTFLQHPARLDGGMAEDASIDLAAGEKTVAAVEEERPEDL